MQRKATGWCLVLLRGGSLKATFGRRWGEKREREMGRGRGTAECAKTFPFPQIVLTRLSNALCEWIFLFAGLYIQVSILQSKVA